MDMSFLDFFRIKRDEEKKPYTDSSAGAFPITSSDTEDNDSAADASDAGGGDSGGADGGGGGGAD